MHWGVGKQSSSSWSVFYIQLVETWSLGTKPCLFGFSALLKVLQDSLSSYDITRVFPVVTRLHRPVQWAQLVVSAPLTFILAVSCRGRFVCSWQKRPKRGIWKLSMGLLPPKPLPNGSAAGTRQLTKLRPTPHPKSCPAGTRLMPLARWASLSDSAPQFTPEQWPFLTSRFFLRLRLQDTLLHTHLPTAAGMRLLVVLKAARPRGPLQAPVCGTLLPATPQPAPPPLAGTRPAMPRRATAAPPEASARTAGTKPRRQIGKRRDTGAAGRRPRERTEGRSLSGRPRPQEPVRGSHGGTKLPPARWDPPHRYWPLEKLPWEHQPWTWPRPPLVNGLLRLCVMNYYFCCYLPRLCVFVQDTWWAWPRSSSRLGGGRGRLMRGTGL